MQEVSPQEVKTRLDADDDFVLLDVREPVELEICSIPGTHLHIPMQQVPARLAEIPRDRDVVVYCKAGGRSARVCQFLLHQGYTRVANLDGGVLAWGATLDPDMPRY